MESQGQAGPSAAQQLQDAVCERLTKDGALDSIRRKVRGCADACLVADVHQRVALLAAFVSSFTFLPHSSLCCIPSYPHRWWTLYAMMWVPIREDCAVRCSWSSSIDCNLHPTISTLSTPATAPKIPQEALNTRLQELLAEQCAQPGLEGLEQKPKSVRKNKVEDIKGQIMW